MSSPVTPTDINRYMYDVIRIVEILAVFRSADYIEQMKNSLSWKRLYPSYKYVEFSLYVNPRFPRSNLRNKVL